MVDAGVGVAARPHAERHAVGAEARGGQAAVAVPVLVALVRVAEEASVLVRRTDKAVCGENRWNRTRETLGQ